MSVETGFSWSREDLLEEMVVYESTPAWWGLFLELRCKHQAHGEQRWGGGRGGGAEFQWVSTSMSLN